MLKFQLSLSLSPLFRYVSSVDTLRKATDKVDSTVNRLAVPRHATTEEVEIPGAQFRAEWLETPNSNGKRILLYLPGGAYVMRTPNMHRGMVARLCRATGQSALMVYYRVAPEHPFPACLDDALLAYQWLLDDGYLPEQIAIAGDTWSVAYSSNIDQIEFHH